MNLLIKVAHLKVAVPPFFAACVLASFLEPPVRPHPPRLRSINLFALPLR